MTLDIYFYEAFEEEEAALRRYLPPHVKAGFTWKAIQEAGESTLPAPLISIRTQSKIPPAWATSLAGILTRSAGFDHVLRYRAETGIEVKGGYLPLYCARAVAEQAMMLWMSLLRKLKKQMNHFESFERNGLTGAECEEKNLLVVGVGNIGFEIAKIGQGLGMHVKGVDLAPKHPEIQHVSFEEGLAEADVLVCAMNLTRENRAYFNAKSLAEAKPGLIFVNVARGEISPVLGLQPLLEMGILGGLGLDVFDAEADLAVSLRSGKPSVLPENQAVLALRKREDVIFTPHNSFNTEESVERKSEQSVRQALHFFTHSDFLWPM